MSMSIEAINSKGVLTAVEYVQMCLLFGTVLLSTKFCLEQFSAKSKKERRTKELVDKFPGPLKYPLIGNLLDLISVAWDPPRTFLDWISQMSRCHGPIFKFWVSGKPKIMISCPETAYKLYSTDQIMSKSSEVAETAVLLGAVGLLAISADAHAHRRKIWNPAFSKRQIENSVKFFNKEATGLIGQLDQYSESGSTFDLLDMSIRCTFRAVCYSALGEENMDAISESDAMDYMHDIHTITVNLSSRIFRPWYANDFFYLHCTKEGRGTNRSIIRGNEFARTAVHKRMREREAINWENKLTCVNNNFKHEGIINSFLDYLLDLHEKGELTEEDVIAETHVFIVAGYDTTGITLCYVLYFLSLYPEHQDKVVKELLEIVNSSTATGSTINDDGSIIIDAADTNKMKHLDLCIKESLRLYPVLPVSPRMTTNDVTLVDGRVIPTGTDVFVMLNIIHRDPKYFSEPDAFIPERHNLPRNIAFMPFTMKSRSCVGQLYALYKIKVVLGHLLLTYEWETMDKYPLKTRFQTLLIPEDGFNFKISKRNLAKAY